MLSEWLQTYIIDRHALVPEKSVLKWSKLIIGYAYGRFFCFSIHHLKNLLKNRIWFVETGVGTLTIHFPQIFQRHLKLWSEAMIMIILEYLSTWNMWMLIFSSFLLFSLQYLIIFFLLGFYKIDWCCTNMLVLIKCSYLILLFGMFCLTSLNGRD